VTPHAALQARDLRSELAASRGAPLSREERETFETRTWPAGPTGTSHASLEAQADRAAVGGGGGVVGANFGSVRLHDDAHAQRAAARLHAHALTLGDHIYLGAAAGAAREPLIAHELAHTLQQRSLGRAFLQPRLVATGSAADIQRFIDIAQPAMGELLQHDPVTGEITAIASLQSPPTSSVFAGLIHRIIDDPVNDAEANFGTAQDRVAVGAFPIPSDLTGPTQQLIDIDDVEAIEAGAPGNGLGKLAHELTENYEAHVAVNAAGGAVAGADQFDAAHEAGVSAESDVAEDTVGPGRRVAGVTTAEVNNVSTRVQDFENYYLVFDLTRSTTAAGTTDFAVGNARQAARVNVSTHVIDGFATGSDVLPTGGAASVAAAAAAVAGAPTATVRIEGFTDDVGAVGSNLALGNRRAQTVRNALQAAGVGAGRIHALGLGEVNFVAPNDTDTNRARNRRVVIVVDRPN
jgi:outer membrane protein OmpA-like peptidoglycan-associated protein